MPYNVSYMVSSIGKNSQSCHVSIYNSVYSLAYLTLMKISFAPQHEENLENLNKLVSSVLIIGMSLHESADVRSFMVSALCIYMCA